MESSLSISSKDIERYIETVKSADENSKFIYSLADDILNKTNEIFYYGISHCAYAEEYIRENMNEFYCKVNKTTDSTMFMHKQKPKDELLFELKRAFNYKKLEYVVAIEFYGVAK